MGNDLNKKLAERLKGLRLNREIRIMEVCGTHTTEFFRTGVKDLFPRNLILVDGPGCPVCVTPNEYLDRAIEIGKQYRPIIATFGDMIKVPSSTSSLVKEKAKGMDIRIVYSPMNALEFAEANPGAEVMFLSVGFETTAPAEAATVLEAKRRNIKNFSILPGNKLTPPAVEALLVAGEVKIDGFILPGHVSAVIGTVAWRFISGRYGKPCVVAGFDASDLMMGMLTLVDLIQKNKNITVNQYSRVVREEGNRTAVELLYQVFTASDSRWRGIGVIPGSGLAIRNEYADFDAAQKFPVTPPAPEEAKGCRCGELLRGLITPPQCGLYGKACTPEEPVGPCMVSMEGPCAAYYKYWSGR
ncbi:MAG: hydrogenase formation protein HypD [Spirochaetes bacterium RBG_13_51_14]|nr:MAG: hydrogenase formation protein HypD [Spirochaetes bacterium RBG_13_51_14]